MNRTLLSALMGLGLLVAGRAQAEPINWCATNPTAASINTGAPECSGTPDHAWDKFGMAVPTSGGATEWLETSPWVAAAEGTTGCSWDGPQDVVLRCLLGARRTGMLNRLWTLHRACDPRWNARFGYPDNPETLKYACRPIQRIYNAMLALTDRNVTAVERGVALAPAPGYVQVSATGPYVVFTERRHALDIFRPIPENPSATISNPVVRALRGALHLDQSRWEAPYTIGRHAHDVARCTDYTCDRDSYSAAQVAAADAILAPPVRTSELSYDAANGCYYANLCAAVQP